MALREVTGATAEEVEKRREKYERASEEHEASYRSRNKVREFERDFCLAKIPRQPDDYTGPDRYCLSTETYQIGDSWRCKHHGGQGEMHEENLLEPHLAPMKHGMIATREHLIDDFDDKDEALYDFIVDSYVDAYDIDIEGDPSAAYDLHRLAAEIVRAERGRGFLLSEGEVNETPVRNDEGRVVVDEDGEVVTEKSEHYLAKMMHRQDKKITNLEKELGVSRKERKKHDQADNAVEAFKNFAEVGQTILDRESRGFDGEEEPWNDEDGTE